MEAISGFFGWLFGTKEGVVALLLGGIVVAFIAAFLLERKTRQIYKNHEKGEGDFSLFDGDEDE